MNYKENNAWIGFSNSLILLFSSHRLIFFFLVQKQVDGLSVIKFKE